MERFPSPSGDNTANGDLPSALEAGLRRRGIELPRKEELKTSLEIARERADKIAATEGAEDPESPRGVEAETTHFFLKREGIPSDSPAGESRDVVGAPEAPARPAEGHREAGSRQGGDEDPPFGGPREAQPSEEVLKEQLDAARVEFLKAEREYGDGTRATDEVADRYNESQEAYERARAEYVVGDVLKYVHEETEVLKQRAEAGEAKGLFGKLHGAWKWLSEKNLSKVFDPNSKILKVGARMFNLRTAISGALIGAAWMIPGAGVGVLAARQALAGAGTTFLAYDLQRKYGEVKAADVSKLDELSPQEVAEKFHALTAFAKLKGSWVGMEGAREKLRERYERDMAIAVSWGMDLQGYTWELAEKEQKKESARKWRAVGAGVLGGLGLAGLRHLASGSNLDAAAAGVKAPAPGLPPVHEGMTPLPNEDLPPVHEGMVPLPGENLPPVHEGAVPLSEEKIAAALNASEAIKNATEFRVPFQPGESPLHGARKALALYLSEDESQAFKAFSPAEKLWAEERLWQLTKGELAAAGALKNVWHPGDAVVFKKDAVEQALSELQNKFGSPEKLKALEENLRDYVGKVDWKRYAVAAGHGAWEGDTGVRFRVSADVLREAGTAGTNERMQGALLEEARRYPALTVPGEEAGTALGDAGATANQFKYSFEDETFVSPEAAANLELVKDKLAETVSGLDAEEYNAIRTMRVSDILKKGYWQLTEDTRWPEGTRQTHVDIMQRLKLKEKIRAVFEALSAEERANVGGLDAHDFIKEFILKGRTP
ncbi:MAG: hypothetical protein Q8Q41_00385 [bacterium]|nr:hypothetical protein [bacterium]